jgi:glycolate oxidase iron-sulfur subunit
MLLPLGCVQPSLAPRIDAATARVFDAVGIELVVEKGAGCCGALPFHLDDPRGAREIARRNIDAWWPRLESGAEAIVLNASGCGIMVHDYGRLLKDDPEYAWRAKRVSERARDVAEVLAECTAQLKDRMVDRPAERVVFHPPCTLQHGLQIRGTVEAVIAPLGAGIMPVAHGQPCCGSAGAYSILQPRLASALRDRKVATLLAERPDVILSANVGCIAHLAAGSPVPVRHWIEWVDERIAP